MKDGGPAPQAESPKITVVVLSYNRPQYLSHALLAISNQSYSNLEVLLVDNLSAQSAEVARVARQYPNVKLLANTQNLGFAQGMNRGIDEATGEFVFLTEDDIVLDRYCIEELVLYVSASPKATLASGLLLNRQSGTIRFAGATLELGALYRIDVFAQGEKDIGQFTAPFETDFAPGCMIFARTRLLKSAGCFRPDFFMYIEDSELCVRLRNRGARLMVVPAAKADHFEPGVQQYNELIDASKLKNLLTLYILHARWHVLPEFFIRYFLLEMLAALCRDWRRVRLLFGAVFSVLPHLGGLLRQRWQTPLPIE